jgi:hypothetical protein
MNTEMVDQNTKIHYVICFTAIAGLCEHDGCNANQVYSCVETLRTSDGILARDKNNKPIINMMYYCRWHGQCWAQDRGIEAPKMSLVHISSRKFPNLIWNSKPYGAAK